tara:strand:+ start:457 stop:762 length:306 start_codon:yes stop_codon:yes gene_type:complete
MKNLNFTKLERQVLRNFIPTQNVHDFGEDVHNINDISALIFDNEGEFVLPRILKGVVGSLCKKNILSVEDHEDNGFNWIFLNDIFYGNQELTDELTEIIKK